MNARNLLLGVMGVAIGLVGGCTSTHVHPQHGSPAKHPATTQPLAAPLTKPTLPPLSQPAYTLTVEKLETLPAVPRYAHISVKTTFQTMQKEIESALKELEEASAGGKLVTTEPAIFVYLGATGQLNDVFTLEIGFAAAAETAEWPDMNSGNGGVAMSGSHVESITARM